MKKFVFLAVIAILAVGTASAQGWGWAPPTPPETVRVQGTLQLQNGQIVLVSGTNVYFVPVLVRYIGFIDGLREGAQVTAEGFAFNNVLQLSRFTVGGRDYDLGFDANTGWGGWCGMGGRWGGAAWGAPSAPGGWGGHHWGGGWGRRGRW